MATLFSKDVLFLHIPKAAGTSVTEYLVEVLPRPVSYVHPTEMKRMSERGIDWIQGKAHQTLAEAAVLTREHGFDVAAFPLVLAVLRNPYDRAVSLYSFLRRPGNQTAMANPLHAVALRGSFRDFVVAARAAPTRPLARSYDFVHLNGAIPRNLKMAKFERLADDVIRALESVGVKGDAEFPWQNRSIHDDFRLYYDDETEDIVYSDNKWMFDAGLYERLVPR